MDRKSKAFFWIIGLAVLVSVGATYYRIVVARSYVIETETACDPEKESCFVKTCDPVTEDCAGEPNESYSKIIRKQAANMPACDGAGGECPALACSSGEQDCEELLCDESTVGEGEECSDPETYRASLNSEDSEAVSDSETASDENTEGDAGEAPAQGEPIDVKLKDQNPVSPAMGCPEGTRCIEPIQ